MGVECFIDGYSQIITFFEKKVHASFKEKTNADLKYHILETAT